MRIAVCSQNLKSITGHAGKTRRFLIIEASAETAPQIVERLDLPAELALHNFRGTDHPLFAQRPEVLLTRSAGAGFVSRLAEQGIEVIRTAATDPLAAAATLATGQPLPPPAADQNGHAQHGHDMPQANPAMGAIRRGDG